MVSYSKKKCNKYAITSNLMLSYSQDFQVAFHWCCSSSKSCETI